MKYLIYWVFSNSAQGIEVVPEHLSIEFDQKLVAELDEKDLQVILKTACLNLGKSVQAGQGPLGSGVFKGYSCFLGDRKIFGKKKSKNWVLLFKAQKKRLLIQLMKDSDVLAEIKLKAMESGYQPFQDPEITDLIAYALMSQLPFLMRVDENNILKSENMFQTRYWKTSETKEFKFDLPKPPERIVYYKLSFDPNLLIYRSEIIGEGQLIRIEEPKLEPLKKKKKKGSAKKTVLKGGFVFYSVSPEILNALSRSESLWAHASSGPTAKNPEIQKTINGGLAELDKYALAGNLEKFLAGESGLMASILESTAAGYVGMRYGLQVLPVEGQLGRLLDDTSIFNLVAEVRGGPLEGLRYYYDKLPETKTKLGGSDGAEVRSSLAFARHVIGFSWDISLDFFINRITIDPKIGVWTFNASLPVQLDEAGNVSAIQDFNLGSTASIALEGGLEIVESWFTLRGFYAFDSGFSVMKQGAKVTSNRFGGDAFFKAGPKFSLFDVDFNTALLASFVYESVRISRGVGDLDPGQAKISSVSYSAGYAGGGGAISW